MNNSHKQKQAVISNVTIIVFLIKYSILGVVWHTNRSGRHVALSECECHTRPAFSSVRGSIKHFAIWRCEPIHLCSLKMFISN